MIYATNPNRHEPSLEQAARMLVTAINREIAAARRHEGKIDEFGTVLLPGYADALEAALEDESPDSLPDRLAQITVYLEAGDYHRDARRHLDLMAQSERADEARYA